jgi:hypothetical protein
LRTTPDTTFAAHSLKSLLGAQRSLAADRAAAEFC